MTPHADYRYRAGISADEVAHAIAPGIAAIDYGNFKASVPGRPLCDAYVRVWAVMAGLQSLGRDGGRKIPRGGPGS